MISNKEKNFISAVVYIHNNEECIVEFLDKLYNRLDKNFNKFEIICVNDSSTDSSVDKIKEYSSELKNSVVSIVNMSFYQGIELSMNAGVDLAIGDFVYEFDSVYVDYDIKTIIDVYYHSLKGFDIVSATPKNKTRKSSRLFYKIFNKFSNTSYELKTESFRILSRRAINRVHAMSKTIPYRKALYSNCGLKISTITYENIKETKIIKSDKINKNRKSMAADSLILFTDVAYKISIFMATLMMISTIGVGIYTIVTFLGSRKPVEGWTTTMLFLSGAFFGVFAILAIIIKYLTLIMDLIFKKQKYTIESIEKITK
jgi:dolichol-phosphate mannosyltransferase